MSVSMRVHTVHKVEYGEPLLSAYHQYDFLDLLGKLGIDIYPGDKSSEDQEIDRQSLEELRDVLVSEVGQKYEEYRAIMSSCLKCMDMSVNQFVHIINTLLNESDQSNNYIHISWW